MDECRGENANNNKMNAGNAFGEGVKWKKTKGKITQFNVSNAIQWETRYIIPAERMWCRTRFWEKIEFLNAAAASHDDGRQRMIY